MLNINEIEETILIESEDFNMRIEQLVTEIMFMDKKLSKEEAYKLASNVIGSLYVQECIGFARTTYEEKQEEIYTPISSRECTDEERDLILMHPEKWDEMDVFSMTEAYEIYITDKGRDALETIRDAQ